MISIILIEPEHPANIGAVARVMANFDFDKLILINPKCNHLEPEAILRAKHSALGILRNAKIENPSKLNDFDYLVGTSAIIGTDYNILRSPLNPEIGARKIAEIKNKKIAVLFGREGIGLKRNEIEMCDFTITIATSERFKAMNISHAVAIVLYEITKVIGKDRIKEKIPLAGKKEKDVLLNLIYNALEKMEFATKEKRETQKRAWKRIIGKSSMTKREFMALCGFFKKI